MYIYMCVYIYIHTHTHTHIYKIGAKFINFNIMPNHMKLRKTHESRTGEIFQKAVTEITWG